MIVERYRALAAHWSAIAHSCRERGDTIGLNVAILALFMCGAALTGAEHPSALQPDDPRVPRRRGETT